MRVNGEDLLTFKYDLFTGTEAILNENGATLLNVSYDTLGRPLRYTPAQPFLPVTMSYDRYGQLAVWSWGDMKEEYTYNRNGRFEGVTYSDGSKVVYSFKDISSVKVILCLWERFQVRACQNHPTIWEGAILVFTKIFCCWGRGRF